jgi:hypothetical protein
MSNGLKNFDYSPELSTNDKPVYVRAIIGKLTRARVQTITMYCGRLSWALGVRNYEIEMMILDVKNVTGILLVVKKYS